MIPGVNILILKMAKLILFISMLLALPLREGNTIPYKGVYGILPEAQQLYSEMKLGGVIDFNVFEKAITGYKKINPEKREIITLVDFTKPSTEKRFYVLDLEHKKLLLSSHVSHGRNSGENFATSFSNQNGSHKSSLGFYITENTYQGSNGYSLILKGLEEGINDKAKERAIVIHGAAYSDPSVATSSGRLGRSFGCPALPKAVNKQAIDLIKGGSLLFIYADDQNYLSKSRILERDTLTSPDTFISRIITADTPVITRNIISA